MKQAVDTVYKLLWLKENDPEKYEATLELGNRYTRSWERVGSSMAANAHFRAKFLRLARSQTRSRRPRNGPATSCPSCS